MQQTNDQIEKQPRQSHFSIILLCANYNNCVSKVVAGGKLYLSASVLKAFCVLSAADSAFHKSHRVCRWANK